MVRITDDQFRKDILEYNLFELIEYYWVDVQNSRNNHKLIYYWWINDKKKILDTLKSKWTSGLLYFEIFVNLTDRECGEFDPTKFYNSEKYIVKLVKVGKLFKKTAKKRKKDFFF